MEPTQDDSLLQLLLQDDPRPDSSNPSDATAGRGLTEAMDLTPSFSLGHGALQLYGSAPDSWQDYLVSSTSAADQSPPSTAGGDGTHSKDLKAQRHRDKSRDAMRRFRQRQKEKSKQEHGKVEELSQQLHQLQTEKDQVEAEYKAFRERESKGADNSGGTSHPEDPAGVSEDAAQLVAADSGELTSESMPQEWEPRTGWDDFNPQATLLLYWNASDEQPIRLPQEALKAMTAAQLRVLRELMLAKAAPHLATPFHALDQPAQQLMQALKSEMSALASSLFINKPELHHERFSRQQDPAAVAGLIEYLDLSTTQVAALVETNNYAAAQMQRLQTWQQQFVQQLQGLLKADAGHHHGYITSYPSMRMVAMRLARCSEDLHRCLCSYSFTVYVKILDPVQCHRLLARLENYSGTWDMTMALAQQHSLDTQRSQQARQTVKHGMKFLEDWHKRHDADKPGPGL